MHAVTPGQQDTQIIKVESDQNKSPEDIADRNHTKPDSDESQIELNLRISVTPLPPLAVCYCASCLTLHQQRFSYLQYQQFPVQVAPPYQSPYSVQETTLANWCPNCQARCYHRTWASVPFHGCYRSPGCF